MRGKQLLGVLVLGAVMVSEVAVGERQAKNTEETPRLYVQASLTTNGPYGESWYLSLTPDGQLWMEVYFRPGLQGNVVGRFFFGEAHMKGLREALSATEFFSMPEELSPETQAFHMPSFTFDVQLDGRNHKVWLYDPERLEESAEVRRFLELWNTLIEPLPFKPTW